MSKEIIWHPSKNQVQNSKLTKFIKYCKTKDYDELEKKSFSDPGWLWDKVIKFSDLKFYKPYTKILDESEGTPECRDGNRTPVMIEYTKGGKNFKTKVAGTVTFNASAGL